MPLLTQKNRVCLLISRHGGQNSAEEASIPLVSSQRHEFFSQGGRLPMTLYFMSRITATTSRKVEEDHSKSPSWWSAFGSTNLNLKFYVQRCHVWRDYFLGAYKEDVFGQAVLKFSKELLFGDCTPWNSFSRAILINFPHENFLRLFLLFLAIRRQKQRRDNGRLH
jgi:hypothetical protein